MYLLVLEGKKERKKCFSLDTGKMRKHIRPRHMVAWMVLSAFASMSMLVYTGYGTTGRLPMHLRHNLPAVKVIGLPQIHINRIVHRPDQNIVRLRLASAKPAQPAPVENSTTSPGSVSGSMSTAKASNLLIRYQERTELFRRQFKCGLLFQNASPEQSRVRRFLSRLRSKGGYPTLSPLVAKEMLKDCQAFKTVRGYKTADYGSPQERDFPLAYIITAHQDFEHVERLLRALYRPQNVFCIHIDKKASDDLKQAVTALAGCFPNVKMATVSHTIVYAHVSRLLADLTCMHDLLNSETQWRYLINMAATELPLKTNGETVAILDILGGLNDIHETFARKNEERWRVEYAVINGRIKATNKSLSPPPHNITLTKGSAYNSFSRAFVRWVLTDVRSRDFLTWSSATYSPDEHYWGSLNNLYHNAFLQTPGGFDGNPEVKGYLTKFIAWQSASSRRYPCHGQIVHNICVFSHRDLPLLPSKLHLAANKFDLTFDPVAYSCMEEFLENRTEAGGGIDLQRYRDLSFLRLGHAHEREDRKSTGNNRL